MKQVMGESFKECILEIDCIYLEGKTYKTAKFYCKNFFLNQRTLKISTGTTADPTDMSFK